MGHTLNPNNRTRCRDIEDGLMVFFQMVGGDWTALWPPLSWQNSNVQTEIHKPHMSRSVRSRWCVCECVNRPALLRPRGMPRMPVCVTSPPVYSRVCRETGEFVQRQKEWTHCNVSVTLNGWNGLGLICTHDSWMSAKDRLPQPSAALHPPLHCGLSPLPRNDNVVNQTSIPTAAVTRAHTRCFETTRVQNW